MQVEESQASLNALKVHIDVSNPDEAKRKLGIEIQLFYQGPDYEDPNPPAEEVNPVAAKKGKAPAKEEPAQPVIRMITPDPVLMTNESGR